MGAHQPTALDAQKTAADFLVISMGPIVIRWKRGLVETVNRRRLDSLKKSHTWATDF